MVLCSTLPFLIQPELISSLLCTAHDPRSTTYKLPSATYEPVLSNISSYFHTETPPIRNKTNFGPSTPCHVRIDSFILSNMAHSDVTVPPEVRANYVAIVDSILAESDLSRISEKKIRQGIQNKVEYDITPQKVSLTEWKGSAHGFD